MRIRRGCEYLRLFRLGKGKMNDGGGLGIAYESGHGDSSSLGVSDGYLYRAIIIICTVGLLWMVAETLVFCALSHAGTFNAGGQALKTVFAAEETILDKVIAATEIGVRSTTTGKTVTGWGVSKFAGSALGPLVTIGISVAGMTWGPDIAAWIASKGWSYTGGNVVGPGSGYVVSGSAQGAGASSYTYVSNYHVGVSNNAGNCLALCQANGNGATYGTWNNSEHNQGGWNATYWATSCYSSYTGGGGGYFLCEYPKPGYESYVTLNQETKSAATIQSAYQSDFVTDGSLARKLGEQIIAYLSPFVEEANKNWPGSVPSTGGYAPLSDAQGSTVQQAFNDAIDPQAKTALQESADQNGTSSPAGSVEGPAAKDWEYTPEQMAAAQYAKDLERESVYVTDWAAEKPDDGNGSTATAGTYTLPERKDLPGVLDTFKAALNNLPIISWASGVNLQVSGASSIVNLPIPAAWGGTITVDFADYESVLDAMGAGLYAIVGMAGVLFLFRGRGD